MPGILRAFLFLSVERKLLAQTRLHPKPPLHKQPLRNVAAMPVFLAPSFQLRRSQIRSLGQTEPARLRLEFRGPSRPEHTRSSRVPVVIDASRHARNDTLTGFARLFPFRAWARSRFACLACNHVSRSPSNSSWRAGDVARHLMMSSSPLNASAIATTPRGIPQNCTGLG